MSHEQLILRGTMRAHTDWVTAIATPIDNSDTIVSSSRDQSLILWSLTKEDKTYGVARRRLTGHGHFVEDVVLSSDGQFALSGSWDGELRLWDLQTGNTARRFVGHTKDVLSVAFSIDNRQIVSASRDKTIKLWNTLGECKYTIQDQDAHSDWVSCVRSISAPVSTGVPMEAHFSVVTPMVSFEFGVLGDTERGTEVDIFYYWKGYLGSFFPRFDVLPLILSILLVGR